MEEIPKETQITTPAEAITAKEQEGEHKQNTTEVATTPETKVDQSQIEAIRQEIGMRARESRQAAGMNRKVAVDTDGNMVRAGLYRGEMGKYLQRGINASEAEWSKDTDVGTFSFDDLLSSAIERSVANGKNEVVVFDFGCGDALVFKDLLAERGGEKALAMLRKHPNVQLKLIGVTDIGGLETKGFSDDLLPDNQHLSSIDPVLHIDAQVAYRSITASQTLENFFSEQHIHGIDLILATQSFPYLSPKNFDHVLHSMVAHLNGGGALIAAPYATRAPGFKRGGLFGEPQLNIGYPIAEPSLKATLNDPTNRFIDETTEIATELDLLKKALKKYKDLGVLTDADIAKRINRYLPTRVRLTNLLTLKQPTIEQIPSGSNEKEYRSRLASIAYLLDTAETNLGFKKMKEDEQQKQSILAHMQQALKDQVTITFGQSAIHMIKRIDFTQE